jgi:GNAT superfamily N-acetyltransferase
MQQVPRLRVASIDDAAAIAVLITQLGYPATTTQMADRLSALCGDSHYRAMVAEVNGLAVGMIGLRVDRGYEYDGVQARIVALVVDESYRGAGIGRALVEAAETWALERGAHKIMVNTAHRRTRTHEFYRSIGYESTGLRFVKTL